MNSTPFEVFSTDTLNRQPKVDKGDILECPHCGGEHIAQGGVNEDGSESGLTLFYTCGKDAYLVAIAGRLIVGTPVDISRRI